jgi:hypothetical protein
MTTAEMVVVLGYFWLRVCENLFKQILLHKTFTSDKYFEAIMVPIL